MREQVVRNVKDDFLKASFRYLVKHGLENTSIRELCKHIGISSGSLYYWFENKDDVYINAARYGLTKVAEALFSYAYKNMTDIESFFNNALDEITKYKDELRLIHQVATSPVYGERMRNKAKELNSSYTIFAEKLANLLGCSTEVMEPVVYLFISIILDYVVWEDYEVAKIQLKHLYTDLMLHIKHPEFAEELLG